MELWDIYNNERQKIGKTMQRGSKLASGEYHLVVHVCIFNSKNQMLIQQRQPFKQGWSNLWDITVGGSAIAGDTSASAAQREVFEEIGYKIDLSNTRPHLTINFNSGFDDFYLIESDVEISQLKLQYEEVQQVKWAYIDDILKMIANESFIPYHPSVIELLFSIRKKYSSHTT